MSRLWTLSEIFTIPTPPFNATFRTQKKLLRIMRFSARLKIAIYRVISEINPLLFLRNAFLWRKNGKSTRFCPIFSEFLPSQFLFLPSEFIFLPTRFWKRPRKSGENRRKSRKAQRKQKNTPLFKNSRMEKKNSFYAYNCCFFLDGEKTWPFSDFRFNISISKI